MSTLIARDRHHIDRAPQVAITIFLVVSFFAWLLPGLGVPLPAFDVRRLFQIVLLCSMTVWIVSSRAVRSAVTDELWRIPRLARWGLLTVVATGTVSSVFAAVPLAGFREVVLYTLLLALGLTVAASRRRAGGAFDDGVTDAVVVVAIAYLATYLMSAFRLGTAMSLPGFEHPRMFNHVQVLLLPLLASASIQPRWERWQRALLLGTLGGWWYLLFVSGGRAAFLAVVAGAVTATIAVGRVWRRWLATYALAGLGGAMAYGATQLGSTGPVAAYGVQNALERGVTTTGRGLLWGLAAEYIREQPLLGIGPGHYAHAPRAAPYATGPHNIPLQFAAEWGPPVALILGVLSLWGIVRWLTAQRRGLDEPAMRAAVTAALVAAGVDASFGDSLQTPLGGTVVAVVAGMAFGAYDRSSTDDGEGGGVRWLLGAGLGLSAIVLIFTAVLTYRTPAEETGDVLRPRFWLNGVVPGPDVAT